MCYSGATPTKKEIIAAVKHPLQMDLDDYEPRYHVSGFAHPKLAVWTADDPHKIQAYQWGFIPSWSKNKADATKNAKLYLNTVCEKLTSTYKPFYKQRCLVFLTGFFEWKWSEPGNPKSAKTPYFIHLRREVFTVGGLYNRWIDRESGEVYNTCSIITTAANELMVSIHNTKKRMPLIVQESDWDVWLNPQATIDELQTLLRPFPEGMLEAHEVTRNITKRGFDTNIPEIQEPTG